MLFRSLKLLVLSFLLASSVELPHVLTFVFSWQGYQLCIRTKYRGIEHAARQCEISMFRILDLNSLVFVAAKTKRKKIDIRMQLITKGATAGSISMRSAGTKLGDGAFLTA